MNQLKTSGASDLQNHERPFEPKRSRFDMSKITNLTADAGMIIPFDVMPILPDDDVDIDTEMVLDTLPWVAPSLTQYKVVTHWYFMKARDMWKGWKTFWTRGRTGNINLTVPRIYSGCWLTKNDTYNVAGESYTGRMIPKGYHSLISYMTGWPSDVSGVPKTGTSSLSIQQYLPYTLWLPNGSQDYKNMIDTGHKDAGYYINALPFVMYQSIVKNNYVNENVLQNNKALFPDEGDDDWILPYNAEVVNFIGRGEVNNADWNNGSPADPTDWVYSYDGVYSNTDNRVRLDLLRYAMFDNDYFTNGLPWLQRGSIVDTPATLSVDIDASDLNVTVEETTAGMTYYAKVGSGGSIQSSLASATSNSSGAISLSTDLGAGTGFLYNHGSVFTTSVTGQAQTTITTNKLREMIALQVWMERNARVDGSYNRMVYQHWMTDPNSEEHKPMYIGGTADYINFTNVVQSSASTSDSPLGTTGGFGSARGGNRAGHLKAKDYGYLMGIMIIKPNTTYEQGFEHFWQHEKSFDSMVQPEFQGLSPEPIYNDEIYISDNTTDNNNLFCYQERYQYLKQRLNQNRGIFSAGPEKDRLFSAYTQARWFTSKPTFNYQFLCMSPNNMRRDMLQYQNYPMFRIQIASKIFVTRKLAYASVPNTFGF